MFTEHENEWSGFLKETIPTQVHPSCLSACKNSWERKAKKENKSLILKTPF